MCRFLGRGSGPNGFTRSTKLETGSYPVADCAFSCLAVFMGNDALDRIISNLFRARLLFRIKASLDIGNLVSPSSGRSSCPQVPDLWPEYRD